MAITVVIIDDEPLARAGLRAIVDAQPGIEVVGEASDGALAVALVARLKPTVVLMDVRMPHLDGIEATKALLRSTQAPPKILIVTTFENDDYVYQALRAGADGFLLKRARSIEIANAIKAVAEGDSLLYPAVVRSLAVGHGNTAARRTLVRAGLTERERAVLAGLTEGLSNAELAARMFISGETVKTHVGAILTKLGVRDRTQAVILAYESGFVDPRGAD